MQKVPGGNELLNALTVLKRAGVGHAMTVADLGCGRMGYFTLQASRMVGENGTVWAVDILKDALANVEAQAKNAGAHNIRTVWADLERFGSTKISEKSVDIVFLINTLFQTSRHREVMKEAARMLKSGGKMLIVDWKSERSPLGPPMERRVLPENIRIAGHDLGLEEADSFEAGPYHFGLLFTKI